MYKNLVCPNCGSKNLHKYFDADNSIYGESHYECLDCHEDGMTKDEVLIKNKKKGVIYDKNSKSNKRKN